MLIDLNGCCMIQINSNVNHQHGTLLFCNPKSDLFTLATHINFKSFNDNFSGV